MRRVEGTAQFLAKELATRRVPPGYIQGLMQEGYAGTLQVLDATNNFWAGQRWPAKLCATTKWQEMVDVYVRDKHKLGLTSGLNSKTRTPWRKPWSACWKPPARATGQADDATVQELKARWQVLSQRFDVRTDNAAFAAIVGASAQPGIGFGMAAPSATPTAAAPQGAALCLRRPLPQRQRPSCPNRPPQNRRPRRNPNPSPNRSRLPQAEQNPPPISGVLLQPVTAPDAPDNPPWRNLALGLGLATITAGGAWRQRRKAML